MSELIFVTSDSCELCKKGFKKVKIFSYFTKIKQVNVEDGYQEYLLRIPVLLKNNEVVDEGIFSRIKIFKKLLFYISIGFDSSLVTCCCSRYSIILSATSIPLALSIPSKPGDEFTSRTKGPLSD